MQAISQQIQQQLDELTRKSFGQGSKPGTRKAIALAPMEECATDDPEEMFAEIRETYPKFDDEAYISSGKIICLTADAAKKVIHYAWRIDAEGDVNGVAA